MQISSKLKILVVALTFLAANTLSTIIAPIAPADAAIAPNASAGSTSSYNWSGFVASGGASYTSVTGTWTVPLVTNSQVANVSADATWVGIGGVSSSDLIQAGTMAIAGASNSGKASNAVQYQAWVETLPNTTQQIPLTVSSGDSITSTISQIPAGQSSAGQWSISIKDNTTGKVYQTNVAYNSSGSSAEWIEEMPMSNNGFLPLDNFGTVQFSGGSAVRDGQAVSIVGSGAQPLHMISSDGTVLASPSALSADGSGFTVTRSSAVINPMQAPSTTPMPITIIRYGHFPAIGTEPEPPSAPSGLQPSNLEPTNPEQNIFRQWQQLIKQIQQQQQQAQQQRQAQQQQQQNANTAVPQLESQPQTQPTSPFEQSSPGQQPTVIRQITPNGWSITWTF